MKFLIQEKRDKIKFLNLMEHDNLDNSKIKNLIRLLIAFHTIDQNKFYGINGNMVLI